MRADPPGTVAPPLPARDDCADSIVCDALAVPEVATAEEFTPRPLRRGDTLSERFVIERPAGSGGMGAVYRAMDRFTGDAVAVKVMTRHGQHEERFAQEARVLAELNHPAIVRYVAHGETSQGQAYLVMEWLEGQDLAQRLAASRLTVAESVEVARRMAEGLAVAHARGLVHRDVKPSNILLVEGQPSRAKLLDFGIVRKDLSGAVPTAQPMTNTGAVLGTAGYMSPEQAIGERRLDARADVFALGCVLFECLTGRPAFSGDQVVAVLAKVLREEAPRVRALRPELPEALDALVGRMLSKDRGLRPEHGGAVLKELVALGRIEGGAPLSAHRTSAGLSGGEQRMTSVILASAPEGQRGVSEIVTGHGGDLARLANGALLVTLGGRGTAIEQVMIAAACALELRDAYPSARIALATGRARTTSGGPMGPVIDRAALLFARAGSPGIRLDEVTAGLLGERFELRQDGQDHALVGKRSDDETPRTLLGKSTPFVGRDKDLALLDGTLRECIDESVARAILVTGPAGQGKSRLCHELVAIARARGDVRVLLARADPVGAGSAFMMVRQLVRRAVGVRDGDPTAEQYAKLRTYVGRTCGAEDAGRIADFLGELIGAPSFERPSPELRSARNDPSIMAEWLRRSFGDWLAAECAARPLLLVLEDLHWGDLPSVTYLTEALRVLTAKPLMLLALARPEVHDAFPVLRQGTAMRELVLGGLTPRAAERLVKAALGDGVASDTISRIVERADGNAFYLEELVRRVVEGGGDALPETVLALVQSRLEGLAAEARRLLRAASVFGEVFWRNAIAELLGDAPEACDLDAWLKSLVDREVFVEARESRFPGAREYTFRHGLLRDAAYAMLTESDRAKGHLLAGAWLEGAGEKDALTMADHYERGGDPSRAAHWLIPAAHAAGDGGHAEAALRLADRGIACHPGDSDRALLRLAQSEAYAWRADWRAAAAAAREAIGLLPTGSVQWFRAAALAFYAGSILGDRTVTAPVLEAIMSISVRPEPSGPYASAVHLVAIGLSTVGQFDLARSFLERVELLRESVPEPDPAFALRLLVARGFLELFSGELAKGFRVLSQARHVARRAGDARSEIRACTYLVLALANLGDRAQTEATARDVVLFSEGRTWIDWSAWGIAYGKITTQSARDAPEVLVSARQLLDRQEPMVTLAARALYALALFLTGEVDGAELEASAVLECPFAHCQSVALGVLALAALRRDKPADALAHAERGLKVALLGMRTMLTPESYLHLARAEALHALGRTEDARAAIRGARDRIEGISATVDDAKLRTSFLTQIDVNVRTFDLASAWLNERTPLDPA